MTMSISKIFDLFKDEPKNKGFDIADLSEHPYYWIVMFNKIMTNHEAFSKKFVIFCSNIDSLLSPADLEKAGEFFSYERAYYYVNKIDLENESHKKVLFELSNPLLINQLNTLLQHYQDIEEYEKCSFLLKMIQAIPL